MSIANDDFDDYDETLCAGCGKGRVDCDCYTSNVKSCEDENCSCLHDKYLMCYTCFPLMCVCEVSKWR